MKRILAIVLALVLVVTAFAGCQKKPGNDGKTSDKPLVVGYSNFSSKFSPFFAETAYDQDVSTMTQISLLGIDRQGAVVELGKTGEDREYNGTSYHYDGPADLKITENATVPLITISRSVTTSPSPTVKNSPSTTSSSTSTYSATRPMTALRPSSPFPSRAWKSIVPAWTPCST
jgi:ABC-type oligopeptide transport system substrate-binding subunit